MPHQERDLLYFTTTKRSVGKNSTDERNSYLFLVQFPGWEKNYSDKRNSYLCLVQFPGWKKTIPMSGIVIY
ncbi:hypothetical protein, partial [Phormidium sp. CCY1219]|uniref:hypothetical protein n=1 Tax=Phormidium sp. CCY1219 TaxID=2886104 RepID=UPI002D7A1182